jgi:phosphohistidine phosphatase
VLLRHGQAEPKRPLGTDRARPLAAEGQAQAASVGRALRAAGLLPDAILSSPAPRALQTARLAAQAAGSPAPIAQEATLYQAGVPDILAALARHAAAGPTLWLVGHNPGLEEAAAFLSGSEVRLGVACAAILGQRLGSVGPWREGAARLLGQQGP